MEVYTIVLIIVIIFLIHKLSSTNFDYWKKRNVAFDTPTPFFGNLPSLIRMRTSIGQWLGELGRKHNQPYFGLFIFNKPFLVIQDPHLVKAVLVKDFDHFQDRSVTAPEDSILGQMMFFSQSPQWRSVRNKLTPVFTTGKLKLMFNLINSQTHQMVHYIEQKRYSDIDVKTVCGKFALDAVAKCAFAIDAKCFQNDNAEMMYIARRMFEFRIPTALRQFSTWFAPGLVKLFNLGLFDPDCMGRLKRIFTEMMQFRKGGELKGHDLVEILLEARNNAEDKSQFSDQIILAQAVQFFSAGFETSSSAMSFALYELSKHQEIQQKLRQEIQRNIEKHNGITYEGIKEMKYLDMVVSETMRMYPVFAFLDRMCNKDYHLPGTDVIVEKGTPIWIPLWALHNNPKYFPEPDHFDPDRFSDKTAYNSGGLEYLPFGDGPRFCIGYRFGMMTVKLGLITILSRFKVDTTENTPIPLTLSKATVILQSNKRVLLKLIPV